MTEHPIIFSGAMVQAIRSGLKTQTRRTLRIQPPAGTEAHYDAPTGGAMWGSIRGDHGVHCPYGKPGDTLWVRETFAAPWGLDYQMPGGQRGIFYRADGAPKLEGDGRWTPAIHMPRAACRLLIKVVAVRVERIQDISESDAYAEGISRIPDHGDNVYHASLLQDGMSFNFVTARAAYAYLWDSLNAKRGLGWETNPYVWVVTFSYVQPMQEAA